ncbi:DUF3618 domain-containing protein [Lichenibacterium minor]|uniref:DUF3618 domain-containing protein n=1 Tax=Lichenibacterium minor TaxID=2316528 RepID=A0A4V1RU47_9HYPH|nr:DUF3618 domain-containing protein [Lichenibacterium minor]RYC29894.1 DUF3618 domain-containing protein [Lichenibacterium minor]
MSGGNGRQSSSEVAHEAEDTRANLASTLEQLRTNLQPQNVMEEVVSNARIGAASVADNLVGVAKQYPIPSVLIAAGSALIMRFFSKRGDTGPSGSEAFGGASPRPSQTPRVLASRPPMLRNPSSFQPAPGRGGSAASTLAEARDDLVEGLSTRGAALRRQAADAYQSTSSQAGEAMQSMSRYLPSDRGEVKSKLSTLFEEQPLVLGAIGLAIGAAIGAALPMTETEDNLMGSTAHRLRDQATDAARHEVDEMRAAAGEAIDNVRHSAADNLKTVVGKAGDSFGTGTRDV